MRNMVLAALGLLAVALSSASMAEQPAPQADFPAEIEDLIFRNANCNWLITHPEPNSGAHVDAQRLYFKCDAIAKDVALLRKRYQNDPRILKAIDLAELPADADDLIHRRMGCDGGGTACAPGSRGRDRSCARLSQM